MKVECDLPNALVRVEDDSLRCEWMNIGEGLCGEYNPDDPGDVNLLRFDVFTKDPEGAWTTLDSASFCTRTPASTSMWRLKKALAYIFKRYKTALEGEEHGTVRLLGEELSRIDAGWNDYE